MNQKNNIPDFLCTYSKEFPTLLRKLNIVLGISTIDTNKVIFLRANEKNNIVQFLRNADHPMGLAQKDNYLALATRSDLQVFKTHKDLADSFPEYPNTFQKVFLPKITYHCGNIDLHDIAFLTNLSHEIRTPMNAIIGFSDLINIDEEVSGNIRKYSDQIIQNTIYLNNIINDIVEISLIELGQINIRNELFNLSQLFDEIVMVVENLPLRKSKPEILIRFEQEAQSQNLEKYSDKTHLKQILINLITNALKYTLKGFITIGYTVKDETIEFFVKDTGVGIPDKEKDKIFVRFAKIDRNGKYYIQGMGIGLSITKGLTEALGGKIWFESEENKGSCFYFSIPHLKGKN